MLCQILAGEPACFDVILALLCKLGLISQADTTIALPKMLGASLLCVHVHASARVQQVYGLAWAGGRPLKATYSWRQSIHSEFVGMKLLGLSRLA